MKKLLFLALMFGIFRSCGAQDGSDRVMPCERDNSCRAAVFCAIETTKNGKPIGGAGGWGASEKDAIADFLNRNPMFKADEFGFSIRYCRDVAKAKLQRDFEAANPEAKCAHKMGFIKELPASCDIPKSRWADCCRGSLCEEYILQESSQQTKLKSNPVGFSQDYVGKINDGYGYFVEYRVTNNLNQKIKDFLLSCNQISKSGTVLASNAETIYDLVEPGQTKKFKQEFLGVHKQTNSVDCQLKSYKK
jgi:hypothetical protein